MSYKINKKTLFSDILFFSPSVYMFTLLLPDGIQRLFVQFLLIIVFCKLIKEALSGKKWEALIIVSVLFFLTMYNAAVHGLFYVSHLDYYSFFYFVVALTLFNNESQMSVFRRSMSNKKKANWLIISFFLILVMSILFKNGVRMASTYGWGISVPVLYGPFVFPHGLSYLLLCMFVVGHYWYEKCKEKKYIVVMIVSVFCCIWTGVRTGLLAMIIMLIFLFFNIKGYQTKVALFFSAVLIGGYIVFGTNILSRLPIFQKTLAALDHGSISNGRESFNEYLLDYYFNGISTIQKVFGIGMENIRYYMSLRWKSEIHAHNDFLNTLLGMGFVGFYLYVSRLINVCRKTKTWIPPLLILSVFAFFNGLFMYTIMTSFIPFVILYYRELYDKNLYSKSSSKRNN